MASHQGNKPLLNAQPIKELLYSSAVMGDGFERRISKTLPQETAENANALFFFAALAVKQFKQATKGERTPAVKETIRFLEDLRNDFQEIARNASDAAKGASHG